MKTPIGRDRLLVYGLATIAGVQIAVLLTRIGAGSNTDPQVPVEQVLVLGDTIPALSVTASTGKRTMLKWAKPDRKPTVLLVFSSRCRWCDSVAPVWRQWLSARHEISIVGLTADSLQSALQYVNDKGWKLAVYRLERTERHSIQSELVGRTPWLYLVDSDGRVRFAGHGSRVLALDSLLATQGEAVTLSSELNRE